MTWSIDAVLARGALRESVLDWKHRLTPAEMQKLLWLQQLGFSPTDLLLLGMDRFGGTHHAFDPETGEWAEQKHLTHVDTEVSS